MESVTVIIPTFRPGKYLFECLDSLENQTLEKTRYNVFIVLNGDKEPYFSTIEECIARLKCKIELVYTDCKGVSNARNIAIDRASGKFVAFIDDDDYVSPEYLEKLLECANSSSVGAIICSNVVTFDENYNLGTDYISEAYNRALTSPEKNSLFARRKFLSSSCCKLIPLSVIGSRRFNTAIKRGEDSLFMASISDKITGIVPASVEAIYYRRLRIGSASRSEESKYSRLTRKARLIASYMKVYISGVSGYNPILFLTRILATIRN